MLKAALDPSSISVDALASRAGMSRELFDAANGVFSGFRGALTSATVGACAAFGAPGTVAEGDPVSLRS